MECGYITAYWTDTVRLSGFSFRLSLSFWPTHSENSFRSTHWRPPTKLTRTQSVFSTEIVRLIQIVNPPNSNLSERLFTVASATALYHAFCQWRFRIFRTKHAGGCAAHIMRIRAVCGFTIIRRRPLGHRSISLKHSSTSSMSTVEF